MSKKLKISPKATLFQISPALCTILSFKKLIIFSGMYLVTVSSAMSGDISKIQPQDETPNENLSPKYNLTFQFTDNKIFVTVEFEEKTEKRSHKTWVWDPIAQCYKESNDIETSLIILIKQESTQEQSFADLWIWRSYISDPAQIAEDCYARIIPNHILDIKRDSGELCWQPVYHDEFVGESVPRFKHKKPYGSYADVSAKSEWNNGKWTVTLSRQNITGHDDDIDFEAGKNYELILLSSEKTNLDSSTKFTIEIPEKLSSTK